MYLVNASQMTLTENAANTAGLSYDAMMENAGRATAQAIDLEYEIVNKEITILIGPGNNGGDGLVAARYLTDLGAKVNLYIWKRQDVANDPNWQRLADYELSTGYWAQDEGGQKLTNLLNRSDIIVDALLGTGVSRPIEGELAQLLALTGQIITRRFERKADILIDPLRPTLATDEGPVVVAVDLPSGLHTDTGAVDPLTLAADLTVTFAAPKIGHITFPGPEYVGQLLIADIDILPEYFPSNLPCLATPNLIANLLPLRPLQGHKGTFGKALLVAGSANYTGAPYLSSMAAYRVGAGVVSVGLPAPIQLVVAAKLTEATFFPLPHEKGALTVDAISTLKTQLTAYSALLVGPGLGQAKATHQFLSQFLPLLQDTPLVLDADALNLLAKQPEWWRFIPTTAILTPHPGEMARLSSRSIAEIEANRLEIIAELAHHWGHIVLYKGAFTVIANPSGAVVVMPFANPALATAGSGDILAGAIVGLLAQKLTPFEAAVAGAYLHGFAGELARDNLGEAGVVAGDLLPLLPLAITQLANG